MMYEMDWLQEWPSASRPVLHHQPAHPAQDARAGGIYLYQPLQALSHTSQESQRAKFSHV